MNRADLQQLATERLREAKALLAARCWSGAYYLAGYAVECGLKSCVIQYLLRTDQFPERRFSEQCWTHNLKQLLGLAGLEAVLAADSMRDPLLGTNWDIAKDWNETSRYVNTSKDKAELLFAALSGKKHGVFAWIKSRW